MKYIGLFIAYIFFNITGDGDLLRCLLGGFKGSPVTRRDLGVAS